MANHEWTRERHKIRLVTFSLNSVPCAAQIVTNVNLHGRHIHVIAYVVEGQFVQRIVGLCLTISRPFLSHQAVRPTTDRLQPVNANNPTLIVKRIPLNNIHNANSVCWQITRDIVFVLKTRDKSENFISPFSQKTEPALEWRRFTRVGVY